MTRVLPSLVALCCVAAPLAADDWPGFRGPHGDGTSDERAVPQTWGPAENLAWKVELPGPGASSPVVLGRRVFLTCFTGTRAQDLVRHVLCFDRGRGTPLWKNSYPAPLPENDYAGQLRQHGFATSTPVTDGAALYVPFGRDGVRAFDLDGKLLWHEPVGHYVSTFGSGASPALVGDRLVVNATVESGALVALDKRTGKRLWKAPVNGDCWSTPAVVELPGGAREIVLNGSGAVYGFDPADGKELWKVESLGGHISSTPVARDGIVYVSNAGTEGKVAMAIRAGGRGDVTGTHVLWTAKVGASHTSPTLVGDRLCWFSGQAVAVDVRDGRMVAKERLDGLANPYSSPVACGGTLVLFTRPGVGYVLRAADFHVVARNDLGDASGIAASPAVSEGQFFIRSNRYLYCIGRPPDRPE
jgi:outer membrane protein assembly factor BamB